MTTALLDPSDSTSVTYAGTRQTPYSLESMADTANLTRFRRAVRELCHGRRPRRDVWRAKVLHLLRDASEPQRYIGELLDLCVHEGGPDGLDMAIDVLSETGDLVLDYMFRFLRRDFARWKKDSTKDRSSDDVWYVLARALAKSDLDLPNAKLPLLTLGLKFGTPSIREAAVHALGDAGGPQARKLLQEATQDSDRLVRESAGEVLADLDS